MILHDIIIVAVLIYLLVALFVWSQAGSDAAAEMMHMEDQMEAFNQRAQDAGHIIPPQAPLAISYQNIFWQGIVWPAYFSARRRG